MNDYIIIVWVYDTGELLKFEESTIFIGIRFCEQIIDFEISSMIDLMTDFNESKCCSFMIVRKAKILLNCN